MAPGIMDYGMIWIQYFWYYNKDIVPTRHAPGSLTFGSDPETVAEWVEKYDTWAGAVDGEGFDTPLFGHWFILFSCTIGRILDGTMDYGGAFTMQCYDNIIADIYLTDAEGLYAELDMFTWKGWFSLLGFKLIDGYFWTLIDGFVLNTIIYMFYVVMALAKKTKYE